MSFQRLLFDVHDGVATITLNQPERFNALDLRMSQELLQVAIQCDEDPAIRAVILTGAGDRAFCAGGDLASFNEHGDSLPAHVKEVTLYLHGAITRFSRMDAPIIAAVNGVAAGAGISLAAFPDLAIASEGARFLSAYTAAGLTPDGSSTYFLPRLIGMRRYMELALTNRTLSAAEALDWGIVNKVVPSADVLDEARAVAAQLAAGPSLAFGRVKEMVHNTFSASLEGQMELETRMIAESVRSSDGRGGIEAFLGKRKPVFEGR
jgi:2-(1,2-epoxy-1,2-dihydrophenyl)acetyl-CoA isomerase